MSLRTFSVKITVSYLLAQMLVLPIAYSQTSSTTDAMSNNSIVLTLGHPEVLVNGDKSILEVAPVLDGGYTLIPFRFIGEAIGAKVGWNGSDHSVTLRLNGNTVILKINSNTALVNESAVELDAPAKIINGSTMVPLRFVGEALHQTVIWDDAARQITIRPDSSANPGQPTIYHTPS